MLLSVTYRKRCMNCTHKNSNLLTFVLIFLFVLSAQLVTAEKSQAHTVTRLDCKKYASVATTLPEWNSRFRACERWRKRHNLNHYCARPRPLLSRSATVKHRSARFVQRRNLTTALRYARRVRAPLNHRIALVAAITQESTANNLPYGHGTSVGILQLINTHGSVAWRMRITNSAGWFLRGAKKVDPHGRMAPRRLAQAVQRSAHPSAYGQWVAEANRTVRKFYGRCLYKRVRL